MEYRHTDLGLVCETCSCLVADEHGHSLWHALLDQLVGMAHKHKSPTIFAEMNGAEVGAPIPLEQS